MVDTCTPDLLQVFAARHCSGKTLPEKLSHTASESKNVDLPVLRLLEKADKGFSFTCRPAMDLADVHPLNRSPLSSSISCNPEKSSCKVCFADRKRMLI